MTAITPCQNPKCENHVSMLVEIHAYEVRNGLYPKLLTVSQKLCADCAIELLKDVHTPLMLGSIKS